MMARLATEPETVEKGRRVFAERETLLEFTARVVAEPETLAEITAGWSRMVTKPRKYIKFLKRAKSLRRSANSSKTCRQPQTFQKIQKGEEPHKKVYTTRVVYTKACQRSCPAAAGTHSKGARQNVVTIPMGGRRA